VIDTTSFRFEILDKQERTSFDAQRPRFFIHLIVLEKLFPFTVRESLVVR